MKNVTFAGRALLAVLLMVGFYAFALGIAGLMLFLVYAQVAVANRISIKLTLICIVGAGAILWSIIPRPDNFEPPGPELFKEDHPKLFQLIAEVARDTNQAPPAEVYLVSDMNAFVTQRGGMMGLFSRRVMGLGLPLLQVLSIAQLRAVIAHEFGHFDAGDTKLGPWIYVTRAAIVRTVQTLAQSGSEVMHKPFEWYGMLFLRITHALSRRQEYAADALAARVAGAEHLIAGLKVTHGGALAFNTYLNSEFLPVVASGFKPPMAEGFSRFLQSDRLNEALDQAIAHEMESDGDDPYDTHPPLPKRIAALKKLAGPKTKGSKRPAASLLRDVEDLEEQLLEAMIVNDHFLTLKDLSWEDAITEIYIPQWKASVKENRKFLTKYKFSTVPLRRRALAKLAGDITGDDVTDLEHEAAQYAIERVGAAIACALLRRGWTVHGDLAEPFTFEQDGHTLKVFQELNAVIDGEMTEAELRKKWSDADLLDVRLLRRPKPASAE